MEERKQECMKLGEYICYICGVNCHTEKRKRHVTLNNYKKLGIGEDEMVEAENRSICQTCWLSKVVKQSTKKCAAPGCKTSRRKINKLYYPPVDALHNDSKQRLLENIEIDENSRICQKCYHEVMSKRTELNHQPQKTPSKNATTDNPVTRENERREIGI